MELPRMRLADGHPVSGSWILPACRHPGVWPFVFLFCMPSSSKQGPVPYKAYRDRPSTLIKQFWLCSVVELEENEAAVSLALLHFSNWADEGLVLAVGTVQGLTFYPRQVDGLCPFILTTVKTAIHGRHESALLFYHVCILSGCVRE